VTASSDAELLPPKACPACRSKEITTSANKIVATAYWRCLTCGEVWNQGRFRATRDSSRRW